MRHTSLLGWNSILGLVVTFLMAAPAISRGESSDSAAFVAEAVSLDSSDALLVYDSTFVEIKSASKAQVHKHVVERVFSNDASPLEFISFPEDDLRKLKKFKCRILDNSGAEIETFDENDMSKACGFGASFAVYQDLCTYTLHTGMHALPFTIEYDSEMELKSLMFWPSFQIEHAMPLIRGVYQVDVPQELKFDYDSKGAEGGPTETTAKNSTLYTWAVDSIPAGKLEPYMPPLRDVMRRVTFYPRELKLAGKDFEANSWSDLSRGYFEIARSKWQLCSEQKSLLQQMQQTNSGLDEQFGKLHDQLIRKMRYVAIYMKNGGWVPHKSEETFKVGYGDCKDLSTMFVSMLNDVSVPSYLVLLNTRDMGYVPPEHPQLSGFDHVIFFIVDGEDTIWCDPTCFDCAVDDLPWQDEDANALVISDSVGGLVHTPISHAGDNLIIRDITVTVDKFGEGFVSGRLIFTRNCAHGLRSLVHASKKSEFREAVRRHACFTNALLMDEVIFDNDASTLTRLEVTFKGHVPKLARQVREEYFGEMRFLSYFTGAELTSLSERVYPIELSYPRTIIDSIKFKLPNGLELKATAAPTGERDKSYVLESVFGNYSEKPLAGENGYRVAVRESPFYRLKPSQFTEFDIYRKKIDDHLNAESFILVPEEKPAGSAR